ncbi:MAG: sulfurtransferase TusA family protein [Gammaproteobacteria bacterium]|nr:sulfurtransferase TusA family protein [Gammaproteobacteria bacterium]
MSEYHLDARNILCPLPVIRTQNAVQNLQKGDRLTVICTDPGALHDIPTWSRINGHRILEMKNDNKLITIIIEVEGLGS